MRCSGSWQRIDRKTVALNLLLLSGTVLIPFATSALGNYPAMHTTTFFYGIVLSYCGTIYNLLLNYLIRSSAFMPSVTPEVLKDSRKAYFVGTCGYYIATLLALWLPVLSFAAYIAIALYYLIPHGVDEDLEPKLEV